MASALNAIGLLVLRLGAAALILVGHGQFKIINYDKMKEGFPDPLGIGNQMSLNLAIFAEVGCAALVMLGLLPDGVGDNGRHECRGHTDDRHHFERSPLERFAQNAGEHKPAEDDEHDHPTDPEGGVDEKSLPTVEGPRSSTVTPHYGVCALNSRD